MCTKTNKTETTKKVAGILKGYVSLLLTWGARESVTCRTDSADPRFLVLFSCKPGMREPDHTYMRLETDDTTRPVTITAPKS